MYFFDAVAAHGHDEGLVAFLMVNNYFAEGPARLLHDRLILIVLIFQK